MAKYFIQDETLTNLADEIRVLSGTEDSMTPTQMTSSVQAANDEVDTQSALIDQLSAALDGKAGGITPIGTKQITENGTYDVASYATAEVNVPEKTPVTTELTVTANGTYTPDSGVDGYSKVTVNVPSSGGGGGSAETCTVTFDLSKTSENSILVYYATVKDGAVAIADKTITATTTITVVKNTPMFLQYMAYDEFSSLVPTANAPNEMMVDLLWCFLIKGDATITADTW